VAGDGISIQNNVISVTNQQTGVQDVQVNGESVVDGKIAYIDINNTALEYFIETENALYGMQEIEWIIRDKDFKWGNGHLQCVEDSDWRYFEINTAVTPRFEDAEGVVMFIRESTDDSYPFYIHSLQHDWSHGGLLYLSKSSSVMAFDVNAGYYDLNRNTGQSVSNSGSGAYSGTGAYETPTAITITDEESRTLFNGNELQGAISSTSIDGETWYGCYIWQASRTYQFSSNHCIDEYLPAEDIPENGYATLADAMNAIIPLYKTGDGKKSGISRYDNLAFFAGADDDLGTNAPIKIWNDGTYQGLDKVEDVRVNGSSVVSNKIADVDLSDYVTESELEDALDDKQDVLTAGDNIDITNNVISAEVPTIEANPQDSATDTLSKIDIDGTIYDIEGGGGGSNARELTKAEYDALSEAEKKNGTIYFIKDVQPPSGEGGVSDVMVNGVSVVDEDGVAHISISIPNNMALCVEGITMNDAQSGVSSDSSIVRMYIPFDTDLDIDDWNVVLRETPSTASWNTYDWRRVSTYSRAGESMDFGRYDSGNHCFRTFGYFLSTKEQQKVTVGGVDYWYSEPLESVNICTTGLTGNLAISGDLIAENSTWDGTHASLKDTIQAILARLS
jgi:hypothetical protein